MCVLYVVKSLRLGIRGTAGLSPAGGVSGENRVIQYLGSLGDFAMYIICQLSITMR